MSSSDYKTDIDLTNSIYFDSRSYYRVSSSCKYCYKIHDNSIIPLHKGLANWCLSSGKPLLDDDKRHIERFEYNFKTPLLGALIPRFESAIDLCLKRVNVNAKGFTGKTPLDSAVFDKNKKYISVLMERKSKISSMTGLLTTKLKLGMTALHLAAMHYTYSRQIFEVLKNKELDINGTDDNRQTALHVAILYRNEEFCKDLLANGALVNVKDAVGNSPIHVTVYTAQPKLLKVIVGSGADVNCRNNDGESALHLALGLNTKYNEIFMILIEHGANKHVCNNKKQTPLHIAAKEGNDSICSFLLDNGANVNVKDKFGNLPLHYIAQSGHVRLLNSIMKIQEYVSCRNDHGETALHIAAASSIDAEEKCELLVAWGADVRAKDNEGRLPLHCAALSGNPRVCKFLLDKGSAINTSDIYGHIPIHYAVKSIQLRFLKCFHHRGIELTENRCGEADLCVRIGSFEDSEITCKLLLDRGSHVADRDNNFQTPLHLAALYLSLPVVRMLLEAGAEVNAQDVDGETPMHLLDRKLKEMGRNILQMYNPTDIAKEMLEWGASSTLKDKKGNVPFHYILRVFPSKMKCIFRNHEIKCECANTAADVKWKISPNKINDEFETYCVDELTSIKNVVFGQYTLLDVFSQYNNPTFLLKDELEATIASEIMLTFQIYGTLLKATFLKAKKRIILCDRAQDILKMPVPNEMVRKILSYVETHDLEHVIKAQEPFVSDVFNSMTII